MISGKIQRINEDITRELAVLLRNIKDPRINQGMISITHVNTSKDLSVAKVFLSVYDLKSPKEFMKGLKSAAGHLRYELGKSLDLRHTPQLHFELDNSLETGARINTILSQVVDSKKTSTIAETAQWLAERDNFLILTHKRPDGDTVGSASALTQGLRELGKTAYILFNPEITPRYERFIEAYWAPDDFLHDYVIAVDIASTELFTDNAERFIDSTSLCIDHHASNRMFAGLTCVYDDSGACGEVIYDILMEMTDSVSRITAECLYVALSTDTGCFAFGNTTADTLYIAAQLIEAGAPNKELNKQLFKTKTRSRIKIEGMLTTGMEFFFDGKVAIATITGEMMAAAGTNEDDLDDITGVANSIEGVCVGVTIREMSSPDDCKISVRTVDPYNAHEICKRFGGGGHNLAGGCMITKTIDEIKSDMLEVLEEIV